MRSFVNAELASQTMQLRQMGGKVTLINSKMCFVRFDIEDVRVSYAYNVNKRGKYFLERIKPYPLPLCEVEQEKDIIELIKIDLEQFKIACKSHHINEFIDINKRFTQTIKKFEDLFLYYNLGQEHIDEIYERLDLINQKMDDALANSKRVYFKKNPNNLPNDEI